MTIMEAVPIIKRSITSRQIVEHYGFKPTRGGYICCPFHGEKTPSLKVHKSGWYCYGCHEGGDAVEFVRLYERCRFNQAVAKVDMYFSLGLIKAEKVSLADLYRSRQDEKRRREEEHALNRSKTAFSARLDEDWKECWQTYTEAYNANVGQRTALQWWNIAIAEDMLEYIDYYQELTVAADSGERLSELMARYEKGVNRDANGRVISGGQQGSIQTNDRDVSGAAGGHVRRDDPPEPDVQQARAAG